MASKYSIGVVALLLGLMMAFQFRTSALPPATVSADRVQGLTMELKDLTAERMSIETEIRDLESRLSAARKGNDELEVALRKEIERTKVMAGVTPVEGPGIEVILRNPPPTDGTLGGDHLFTVRDEDLLRAANELRAAGAEALAINGQRLTGSSEIRLAGAFINVNMNRITPPYRIQAIGDPEALRAALEMTDGLAAALREWGVDVEIKTHPHIEIPGYQGPSTLLFAQPVRGQSAKTEGS
ncbi:MAG: DUF881 domain-containing protein [Bacillota bacterium]|nr:DUF881 domain-containing protein [Bacillota bacterium]